MTESRSMVKLREQLAAVTKERDWLRAERAEARRMKSADPLCGLAHELAPGSFLERACVRLVEQQSGYPAGGEGGAPGKSDASRTATLAERRVEYGTELSDRDYADMSRLLRKVLDLSRNVLPSEKAVSHLASQASDACPAGCCESCWRAGTRSPTRSEGSRHCRWCSDWIRDLGMDPLPLMLVEKHCQGLVITDRDVRIATGGKHG